MTTLIKLSLLLLPVFALSGCFSPSHMVLKQKGFDIFSVQPEKGKAAIVLARTMVIGSAAFSFHNYLEKEAIGTLKKNCLVKTNIEPGEKYLLAKTEAFEVAKINFLPDRVYYVHENPRPGWAQVRVVLLPQQLENLQNDLGNDGCDLYEPDSNDPMEELTDEEYRSAIGDYEREVKEGYHGDWLTYMGYPTR